MLTQWCMPEDSRDYHLMPAGLGDARWTVKNAHESDAALCMG